MMTVGVLAGVVGAVGIATPAHAHRTSLSESHRCDAGSGTWVVMWTVTSEEVRRSTRLHELVDLRAEPSGTVDDPPLRDRQDVDEPFTIVQRVPGERTSASLSVRGKWYASWYGDWYSFDEDEWRTTTADLGTTCPAPPPEPVEVDAVSTCTGLVVTLTNPAGGREVTATVDPDPGETQTVPLSIGDSVTVSFPNSEDLTVNVEAGDLTERLTWEPQECVPPEPGEVLIAPQVTCDELIVTLANPADGVDAVALLTPSTGEEREVPVPVGETVPVTFPGTDGLTVDVAVAETTRVFAWVPGNCAIEVPIAYTSDCDSLTVQITNPRPAGPLDATVATRDETQALTLAPLETGDVVLAASGGTVATVTAGTETLEAIWDQPAGCGGGAGGEASGGLPSAGSTLTRVTLSAVIVLALGTALFLAARRSPWGRRLLAAGVPVSLRHLGRLSGRHAKE